jgi:iron complex transport system substrate-binding protein
MISGIAWVSELIEIAGGDDIFPELATEKSARNRIVTADEVIRGRTSSSVPGAARNFAPRRSRRVWGSMLSPPFAAGGYTRSSRP